MAAYSSALPVSSWAWNLALFGTGAIVMRGAGCTINDLWDRNIDKKVGAPRMCSSLPDSKLTFTGAADRTKMRPIASGEVKPIQAITFLGGQLSVGLAILTQLNWYRCVSEPRLAYAWPVTDDCSGRSIGLGASSLSLVVLYPLMKRITYWPQFVLGPLTRVLALDVSWADIRNPTGMAFNWGALLGSSAVLGVCDWQVALPLYAGSIAWTIVYDTIYAHQDKVDDVKAGVKSTALLFAERSRPILTAFSASFISLLALSGYLNAQGPAFYALSVGGAAAHLAWQLRNADLDSRESCWEMFKSNRDLGAIVWSGMAIDYALKLSGVM